MTDRTVMEHPVSECEHPIDAFSAALTEIVILHAVAVAVKERAEDLAPRDNRLLSLLYELTNRSGALCHAMDAFLINADEGK